MAVAASKDSVEQSEQGPDYAGALALMRGEIREAKEDTSSLGQQVGQAWKRIEKTMGLNRKGAQMFNSILFLAPDTQKDIIRTFMGLLKESGMDRFNDLVDRMERGGDDDGGERAPKPAPSAPTKVEAKPEPDHPADDSDLAGEDAEEEEEDGKPFDPESAKAEATEAVAGGAGFDQKGEAKAFTASEEEWNAAAEAEKAKQTVAGKQGRTLSDGATRRATKGGKGGREKLRLVH